MSSASAGPPRTGQVPTKKRKRAKNATRGEPPNGPPAKQPKREANGNMQFSDVVKHALLVQYYPEVQTLRQYVLDKLPPTSKIRRKKIAAVGNTEPDAAQGSKGNPKDSQAVLTELLDTTFIGTHFLPKDVAKAQSDSHFQQWIDYSQKGDDSHVTISGGVASAIHFQSEIVDFVIWLLFSREKNPSQRPHHLLCDGFRKKVGPIRQGAPSSIQDLCSLYFNERVAAIKREPWPQLLALLGKSGESIMINLLLECAIFLHIDAGRSNYYQLSGPPIFECKPLSSLTTPRTRAIDKDSIPFERKPTEITFVRSRMLYARAALNARGLVHFGLRHIHALNRFPLRHLIKDPGGTENNNDNGKRSRNFDNTLRVIMYMFPRQFALHNAFTSHVDTAQTAQRFQDYTLREEEIFTKFRKVEGGTDVLDVRIPKRLRGKLEHLVQWSTSDNIASHLCSSAKIASLTSKLSGDVPRGRKKSRQTPLVAGTLEYTSLTELAIPISRVSAFCQAVLTNIIPQEFWGDGDVQAHNSETFLKKVDSFVKLRRFETISLHEVMQGLKITEIGWLEPPGLKNRKCSQTDFRKRSEIFYEFLYYIFDSLVIPLIRSNFYVTESNVHRYRLYFFRHDVWRSITEPAMAELKTKMFEEVKVDEALRILDSRRLSYSQVRLLPKQTSVRPIMNLRRRSLLAKDKKVLGQSINAVLGPVYNMLKLEKDLNAGRLGSAMFSVGDIYGRIGGFKQRLGQDYGHLYFAKIDVQAAFDTIPQSAIIALMRSIPSQSRYEMVKHVEVRPNDSDTLTGSKAIKRWHSSARSAHDKSSFMQMIERQTAPSKKNAVYVDSVFRKAHSTRDLLALMDSHIQQNLVKIGKKYYRQKDGIPQGSVISSVLCNYFYADLETKQLQFLQAEDCLLLRLIDDFLLITTDKSKASDFVTVMQKGMPEYGVTVSPGKTLVNFDMAVKGTKVPRLRDGCHAFPYCGTQIDCQTLEIAKDRGAASTSAMRDPNVSNSLTVEFSRHPGQNFRRKVINSFKIQSNVMFFDTRHNTLDTVLRNLQESFVETATKAWAYVRCLPPGKQPSPRLIVDTISNLVDVAYSLLTSTSRKLKNPGYECKVTKAQVRWSALGAFRMVLGRKQARFGEVLSWVDEETAKLGARKSKGGNVSGYESSRMM
ncbi:Telomerase reverse transcriptase [Cytospora mali]|uniref:Telomerase reverse transcriptase n=1 Tax=Cytospora mali TaxID=578113 RepID=A0A194VE76_CYTMA|nr:Telomerase reverse transcriptase [Valsa mali var. pyri (nom. inval.)]